jgi:hypothetical protein
MKKILSIDDDICNEYTMIAISSHLKDYRLSWAINKLLVIDLERKADYIQVIRKKERATFPFFSYENFDFRLQYFLVANKKSNYYLIDKLQQTEYLFLIKNQSRQRKINDIVIEIRKITNILTAFFVKNNEIKNLDALLYDFEFHNVNQTNTEEKKQVYENQDYSNTGPGLFG